MRYRTGIDGFMVASGCFCLNPSAAHELTDCMPVAKDACWWRIVHLHGPDRDTARARDAAQLVEDEDWTEVAARLRDLDPDGDASGGHAWDAVAETALACLARGRLEGLRVVLADEADLLPLPVRVLLADADVRAGTATDTSLRHLSEELDNADVPRSWRQWMAAIRAEYHAFAGEAAGMGVAFTALGAVDSDPGDLLGRMACARLRRLVGIVGYFLSNDKAESKAAFEEASAELAAICQSDEALVTIGIGTYARTIDEDAGSLLDGLADVRDALVELGSDRVCMLDYALAWTAYFAGDMDGLADCLELWGDRTRVSLPTVFGRGMDVLEAILAVIAGDAGADALAEAAALAATDPRTSGFALTAADALLDEGHAALVPDLLPPSFSAFWESSGKALEIREILARLHLLSEPSDGAVAELHAVVEQWAAQGDEVRAGLLAIRGAIDCLRVGRRSDAARLVEMSEAHRSDVGRRLHDHHARRYRELFDRRDVPGEIHLLGPDVVVIRRGREVHLSEQGARLLALLAGVRRAVTRDWLITAMWPELDYETGRKRLKVAIFRLRQAIDLAPGELIVANRNGVVLDAAGWRVDIWEFLDLAAGDTADRLAAFALYKGDVGFRQLAYDDALGELRDELRERWLALGSALVADGALDAQMVARRAGELGIDSSGLRAIS